MTTRKKKRLEIADVNQGGKKDYHWLYWRSNHDARTRFRGRRDHYRWEWRSNDDTRRGLGGRWITTGREWGNNVAMASHWPHWERGITIQVDWRDKDDTRARLQGRVHLVAGLSMTKKLPKQREPIYVCPRMITCDVNHLFFLGKTQCRETKLKSKT